MREIKFRGVSSEPLVGDDNFIIGTNLYINYEDNLAYINDMSVEFDSVRQYTGLKDKNGTEIYEGDIFALEVPYIDFVIGETIYEKEYIPVTYESGSYVLYEQGIQEHNLHDVLTGWRIKEGYKCSGVVVGNIHEHKHLLEAE